MSGEGEDPGTEGGEMMEGVSSNCRHRVEGVEAMDRKMVEGPVESGHCREGSEGLERQEGVVAENSPSQEVRGGCQGDGRQGKHHHGLTTHSE